MNAHTCDHLPHPTPPPHINFPLPSAPLRVLFSALSVYRYVPCIFVAGAVKRAASLSTIESCTVYPLLSHVQYLGAHCPAKTFCHVALIPSCFMFSSFLAW